MTDPKEIYRQIDGIASVNPELAAELHQRYESWTTDPDPFGTEIDIRETYDQTWCDLTVWSIWPERKP